MQMRSIHVRTWVGAIALATVSCGGEAQFVSKSPSGSWYGEFSKTVEKGAKAMGCTMERHENGNGARSFSVSCSKPEYRYVGIAEKGTGDNFLWTCSVGESACRAFVDELIAAAK